MSIFKANDIRGIYGKELFNEDAYALGHAFVVFTKAKKIVVGRDNRKSSPSLHAHLLKGLTDAGADVIDIGIIDSPGAYFASHHFKKPLIMITASHNPPHHNGFYLCKANALCIYRDNGLRDIEKIMISQKRINAKKKGKIILKDILQNYSAHVLSCVNTKRIRPLALVVDAGNGVGAISAQKIFKKIPSLKITPLFFSLDGSFPNRSPDTSIEKNLRKLGEKVRSVKADFGIAFDGDADRASFVDEKGEVIEGSLIGALLAKSYLKNTKKKEKVIYTIGCSKIVPETIKEREGIALREKVGHSFVNAHMHKEKALLGIEHTGHYFYRNNFYSESPLITLLILCRICSEEKKPLSKIISPLKKYYMAKEVSVSVTNQEHVLAQLKQQLGCSAYQCKMDTFDGLYLDCGNYWFRIRASQTEPLVRFVIEGKNKEEVEEQKRRLAEMIKKTASHTTR